MADRPLSTQIGGSSRACHPTADSTPRSAGAGHRSTKLQQVERKYGCQDFHWRSAALRSDYLNVAGADLRLSRGDV